MRIKCLAQDTTAAASRFEPGTTQLRVCGLIHWATTAPSFHGSYSIYVAVMGSSWMFRGPHLALFHKNILRDRFLWRCDHPMWYRKIFPQQISISDKCLKLFLSLSQILRSMLYRGSEIMREVGWVIFDEIHYMRDKSKPLHPLTLLRFCMLYLFYLFIYLNIFWQDDLINLGCFASRSWDIIQYIYVDGPCCKFMSTF